MPSMFRYSELARKMQPSPIRELFRMIQQPGMISFAGGLPDPAAFPVGPFADCADVLSRDGRQVLQYGASEGYPPLREILLAMMADRLGYEVGPDELLITSGSQQGANLAARVLLDPGDVVIVEAPTYPGTIHSLRNAGARFATVPCDADGMRVELLPGIVARTEAETGRRPKLIYTVPDFSNPSGACMSLDRRQRLVAMAAELEIPVLEDDPYGKLRYTGKALPNLKRIAGGASAGDLRLILFQGAGAGSPGGLDRRRTRVHPRPGAHASGRRPLHLHGDPGAGGGVLPARPPREPHEPYPRGLLRQVPAPCSRP